MSKLHMSQVETSCERFIKTMKISDAFEVLTFKKDRGFRVLKLDDNHFAFMQFGYIDRLIEGDINVIKKSIKKALPVEFPRSNIAWVNHYQNVDSIENIGAKHQSQYNLL